MSLLFFITVFFAGGLFFSLVVGVVMLRKYAERSVPNCFLALSALLWIAFGVWYILTYFVNGLPNDKILSLPPLIWALITGLSSMSYPLIVMCRLALCRKILWAFGLGSLILIAAVVLYWLLTGKGWEQYSSYEEVWQQGWDFSIGIRVAMFLLSELTTVVIMWLVFRLLPLNEKHIRDTCSDLQYNMKWLRFAVLFYNGVMVSFTINMFWFSEWTQLIYILIDFPLWLLLFHQVIFGKTYCAPDDFVVSWSWKRGWYEVFPEKQEIPLNVDQLMQRLCCVMQSRRLYTEKSLTRDELAQALQTNRTTLAQAIQKMGYDNFQDYINRLRLGYFKELAAGNPSLSLVSLYTEAGFSSRSTFYAYFTQQEGQTPARYLELLNMK